MLRLYVPPTAQIARTVRTPGSRATREAYHDPGSRAIPCSEALSTGAVYCPSARVERPRATRRIWSGGETRRPGVHRVPARRRYTALGGYWPPSSTVGYTDGGDEAAWGAQGAQGTQGAGRYWTAQGTLAIYSDALAHYSLALALATGRRRGTLCTPIRYWTAQGHPGIRSGPSSLRGRVCQGAGAPWHTLRAARAVEMRQEGSAGATPQRLPDEWGRRGVQGGRRGMRHKGDVA